VIFICATHSFLANEKIRIFLARSEPLVNDILSLKTIGSGDENDHFTVVSLVAWPLNGGEAGVDLVFMGTSMLFLC